jgi:hypothetical protein
VLLFTDGGMRESPLEAFQMLDLDTHAPARPMQDSAPGEET